MKRRFALGLGLLVLAAVGAVAFVRPRLERGLAARLEREAARRGLSLRVGATRLGPWPPVRLQDVHVERERLSLDALSVELRPRLAGTGLVGRTRVAVGRVTLAGPAGLSVVALPTAWDLCAPNGGGLGAELREPEAGLGFVLEPLPEGARLQLHAAEAPLGLLHLLRDGQPLCDIGPLSGTAVWARTRAGDSLALDVRARAFRLAASFGDEASWAPAALGPPADVSLRLRAELRSAFGVLDVPEWRATFEGATLRGRLRVSGLGTDPQVDAWLEVERLDFARLFAASSLPLPAALAPVAAAAQEGGLGSASLSVRLEGRLQDPASLRLAQQLDFRPPRETPPALARLRGDFVHLARAPGGAEHPILVSPENPDFIALADVPPLFVRTLLLAEDSNFLGHRGLDLSELPSSVAKNLALGRPARGASTITQQLAKNLFLSRDKRLGRKLQELSLALLLESTLGKQRILEIYLNVIEWGPELYGLRPAARRYFQAEPSALSPAQQALLVTLIPGPIKYQSSLRRGALAGGLRRLVDDLLAKLRSVDALDEPQYQAALAEELAVHTEAPAAALTE